MNALISLIGLSVAVVALNPEAGSDFLPPHHRALHYAAAPGQACWGYESDCRFQDSLANRLMRCDSEFDPYDRRPSKEIFFNEADFGYVRQRRTGLQSICEPTDPSDSALFCSNQLQFCVGSRIAIDFRDLEARKQETLQYSMDVLKPGQMSAKCRLHQQRLQDNLSFMAPLQSWAPELRNLRQVNNQSLDCDVIVDKPTYIMKIDAAVNMYHHFCDFLNLYASLHINSSDMALNMFSRDVHILIWENRPYQSNFASAFDAFTQHPIWNLNTFSGKKVCFNRIMLPLLPRMIYGLYYNTPLQAKCSQSALFVAFSEFLCFRLGVTLPRFTDGAAIRVTILNRLTKFRRILNLDELVAALQKTGGFHVSVASFTHATPFLQQLQLIRNSDLLVGIHGAGLSHLLFLPPWAAVVELYDCEDPNCYQDLARLRGVGYFSWTEPDKVMPEDKGQHPTDPNKAHAKFTNYAFDPDAFGRLIQAAAAYVLSHPQFQALDRRTAHSEL